MSELATPHDRFMEGAKCHCESCERIRALEAELAECPNHGPYSLKLIDAQKERDALKAKIERFSLNRREGLAEHLVLIHGDYKNCPYCKARETEEG